MMPFGVSSMMRLQVDCINSWSCDDMKKFNRFKVATFISIFYHDGGALESGWVCFPQVRYGRWTHGAHWIKNI
jgi:hypothetical protein